MSSQPSAVGADGFEEERQHSFDLFHIVMKFFVCFFGEKF